MVKSRVSDEEVSKTISVKGINFMDWKHKYLKRMPEGFNISYYQVSSGEKNNDDREAQAVINFLTSNMHINPKYNKTRQDIDNLIESAFSKVLESDTVKSASDYYKVNNRRAGALDRHYILDTPLDILEDTEYDSYIHRATRLQNTTKEDMPKMARIWGNRET